MSAKIQKLRQKIGEIKGRIADLQSGDLHIPKEAAAARLSAWLDVAEAEGAACLSAWCGYFTHAQPHQPGSMILQGDPFAFEKFQIALHPDASRARMLALLDQRYQLIGDTINPSSVPKVITELAAELLQLERDDYRESLAANIPARADTDPRILLGL